MNRLRLVFIGNERLGSNARSLREGFVALGHSCYPLDAGALISPERWSLSHIHRRLLGTVPNATVASFRRLALDVVDAIRPDGVVIFKGTWLDRSTAERLAATAPVIDYHPDDIGNPENISDGYLESVPLFRLSITHRDENLVELEALGAQQVSKVPQAFDPHIHQPLPGVEKVWDVSFVGSSRPERQVALAELATRTDLRVRVAGSGWRRPSGDVQVSGPVWGIDMARIIASSTMSLGFVNHQNRDLRTYRTFEIPAIGSLFLAERTAEHLETFRDGVEAAFFSSVDELVALASHYAEHPAEADALAAAGNQAVWRMGATYERRAEQILDLIRLGH